MLDLQIQNNKVTVIRHLGFVMIIFIHQQLVAT